MLKKLVIVGSLLAVGPLLAGCPGLMAYHAVEAMRFAYVVTKGDHVGNKAASESASPNNASKSATETTSHNPRFDDLNYNSSTATLCEALKSLSYNQYRTQVWKIRRILSDRAEKCNSPELDLYIQQTIERNNQGRSSFSNQQLCYYVATYKDRDSLNELHSRGKKCSQKSESTQK